MHARGLVGLVFVLLSASGLAACESDPEGTGGTGVGGDGSGGGAPADGPTFYKDVLPLLQRSCLTCHSAGRIGGFSLATYEEAKTQAGMIAAVTEAGIMPPWHAAETDACQPRLAFRDDPRLTDDEKALLRAWDDAGAPEGDPADGPPDFQIADPDLENADITMTPAEPFTVEGDRDEFVCVVYDPGLDADENVEAIHVVPGNTKVAHHALVFRLDRASADELSGGSERFDCFGAPPGDLIHAWAPGGRPLELPPTVGMPLAADQVLVVQMHYHPTGTSTEEDATSLQVRFMDDTPVYDYQIALPGNESGAPGLLPDPDDRGQPEFRIPAGSNEHVEQMTIEVPTIPIELPILVVANHMHYVGVDQRFWIERASPKADEPETECLLQTPSWDFNWQRLYMFDGDISELPTASSGDKLRLECRYDNSMSNPFVVQALAQQGLSAPQDVFLGETTLDEMCLAAVGFLTPHL